jgi:molybdate transport system ATP-binding protein
MASMDSPVLMIENLGVNIQGKAILHDISLKIERGEQWAIFGDAGAGKSVLAHTLSGQHAFHGQILFSGHGEIPLGELVLVVDQQHRFRDLQNQRNFYYQQRYNSFDAEATITVEEDLTVFGSGGHSRLKKEELLEIFQLYPLRNEPLIQLSNGENKRLQILKAVLRHPRLLILDEPFTGLDSEGRGVLERTLLSLTASGQQIVLMSSRDHIPACLDRYARLENGALTVIKNRDDISILRPTTAGISRKPFPSAMTFAYSDFRFAVRMCDVKVRYGAKIILEGINWEVESGSCWALTGKNGAGKSTLLSLITGDNPQAYANEIYLFDRRRGSGESIWEIKQKTGFLSPELELYFDPAATAFSALASGLFDTVGLFRILSPAQEKLVREWLRFLNCEAYSGRLLNSLPAGMRRLILLGRAMIKTPPLLILDEPCQGLDAGQTAFALDLIDRYCAQYSASLIYVSHYEKDFPACIQNRLTLNRGKMA